MRLPFVLCLSILLSVAAFGAPPDVPRELKVKPGQLVRVVAKGDGEIGTLRSFDDDKAFFDELAPRKGERRFVFQANEPGVYVVGFWTRGETEGVATTITVDGTVPIITPPPKKPVDPVVPPPVPTSYYFLIVRPDGPAAPTFTQTMGLPAWATLKAKGHVYKDKTVTAARTDIGLVLPVGAALPVVLTLDTSGGVSKIVRGPIPLPITDADILKLPEGVR